MLNRAPSGMRSLDPLGRFSRPTPSSIVDGSRPFHRAPGLARPTLDFALSFSRMFARYIKGPDAGFIITTAEYA